MNARWMKFRNENDNEGTAMKKSLLVAGFAVLLGMAGCSPPPPPVLTLTINGTNDQNPDPTGRSSPVAVRVYQLSGTGKFEQADVFALKDNEQKALGQDAATASTEYLVAPGDNKTITVNLKPNVSAIGVAVLYRDIDRAAWRADAPAAANGPTKLTATVGKLALQLKGG
jgi:type VI secretion system protein VasD